jgi:hypothetical protein
MLNIFRRNVMWSTSPTRDEHYGIVPSSLLEGPPMSTSVNVNSPTASANLTMSFLSPRGRTRTKGETTAELLLVAVGLVLLAVANIYFNYLVGPTDLPFLGQLVGQ